MNHRPWIFLCLLLLLGGCGRKSPPVAVKTKSTGASAAASTAVAPMTPEMEAAAKTLQNRSAPELGQQLLDTKNPALRQQAAVALADMGEKGYPHLFAAMKSNNDEQRLAAIQVIDKPTLMAHRNDMIPMLEKMLGDREPMIRRSAAARLCWFGSDAQRSLGLLTGMANDPNELPDIQQVAKVSIDLIRNAKGTPSKGVDKGFLVPATMPTKGDPKPKS